MVFTVTDLHDLIHLLYEHPDWRAEVRRAVLTDEILELPALVRQLAEEQRATAETVRALAEAQRRSEERLDRVEERLDRVEAAIERLAEAQRRSEERLDRVEAAVERLAEAQRRTEARVEELAAAQRSTDARVDALAEAQRRTEEALQELIRAHKSLEARFGQFQAIFGATVEDEAGGVLRSVMREKGYRPLAEPFSLAVDGEVDVVLPLAAPDGAVVWAVAEAKARLSHNQVEAWAQRMRSSGWRKRLADQRVPGPFLVYAFGIRVDRSAVEEAERQGIGLLTGQGERVEPKGLVSPIVEP